MEISIHGVERKVHEFGDAIAALARLSGTSEVSAAVQACNFLAALSGPRGGLVGLGGEVHPIGTSMISLGADSPAQARLTELLISPLRYLQEDLVEYNRRVDPGWLSRMSTMLADPNSHGHGERRPVREEERAEAELRHVAGRAEKSAQVVSESHPLDRRAAFRRERELSDEERNARAMFASMSPLAKVDYEGMIPFNEARCLREPLVLLESFIYLPATALWSLQHLSAASDDRELVPRAFHLAEEAMRMHLGLMKQGLEAGQLQSMEEDGLNMLRKLAQSEPCRFRDLQRRYDIQRKSLHEPVLQHLIETNRVRRVQKGLLQLTEQGRHELEAMKVN